MELSRRTLIHGLGSSRVEPWALATSGEIRITGYENYVRISLGTMDEMVRARQVFETVLG